MEQREQGGSTYDDDMIDLLGLLMALKKRLWLIVLAAVLGGGLFGVYSEFIPIPQYTSSAMIYVLSKETTLTSLADLQIGSQLSEDYKVIILTRPLLQEVIERLELDMSYRQLRNKISITDSSERILTLTVTDADPQRAMQIVNQLASSASDYIGDIMEMIPPKIIEDGVATFAPVSPNIKKNICIGALLGILLACGIVTIRFILNDAVYTEEDVERYLDLVVLASVPERGETKEAKRIKWRKKSENETDDAYAYNEAIRTLRTNLQFSGHNINVIMITSSLPDEGKSNISLSLASSLAQIGKRTVLVDADIRKSVLLSRYEISGEVDGLSQYLSGQCALGDIIYEADEENLHVIFAGPYSPNPAELLEEELCGQMFKALRASYDYVIVDTPPVANLTDGAIVARYCDGAVIVIESGAVSYRLEQKVKGQLEKTECRILGAVLNKVDQYEKGYYGKYGKYGKYGAYEKNGKA